MTALKKVPLEIVFACFLGLLFWLPRFDLFFKMHWGMPAFAPITWLNLALFDTVVAGYFLLPWLLLKLLAPTRWQQNPKIRPVFTAYLTFSIFLCLFVCISEFFFIDEFSARYNFIAVDYLVYTSEVLKNIWESYHIVWITLGVILVSVMIAWSLMRNTNRLSRRGTAIALGALVICFFFVREDEQLKDLTEPQREISKNSFHALFAAFRNNQIDYEKFYSTLPDDQATAMTSRELSKDTDLRAKTESKKWNVMFVLMESMSAKYMRPYGGEGLTPNLDRLFNDGLTFDHIYSTGTRTVRGIEAVLLSLPPSPK